ncbi:MAG: glycosyltransferase family 2 protein [Acidobacteria bacterium]|nr:glycosyltransferase family 2 protein [Acidobacteriota bacterium]MCA1640186.1 glycosyltransferase family 2 protein [Acidobacteriota bacterium]
MIFIFYFFALILTFLGYKSMRSGINYLNYFKKELVKPKSNFTPFCSIIAPCRGLDEELSENLFALFRQNYPKYEILFVVDSDKDKAISVIEEVSRKGAKHAKSKLIIAGKAIESGQKVHNLRQAVLEVSDESKVFVFVDSDARPNEDWLRNLIAPLQDESVGAATGYRWFVSKRGGLFSQFLSVWNASIASALGANAKNNFCWGGSTAIRRETFEKLDMRKKWRGTLSDDFAVTQALKEAKLKIYFVPQCLMASIENCSFSQLLEFTTRQMKITRVYAPHLWKASFAGSLLFSFTFWSGFTALFFLSSWHFWLTLALSIMIFALGAAKAWLRLKAVKIVLKDYRVELDRQFLSHITIWTLSPILYFYNCFCALLSRKIVWRGIGYELKSPNKTVIIADNAE